MTARHRANPGVHALGYVAALVFSDGKIGLAEGFAEVSNYRAACARVRSLRFKFPTFGARVVPIAAFVGRPGVRS